MGTFKIFFYKTDSLTLAPPGSEMDKTILVSRIQQLGRHFPTAPVNLE